LLVMLLGSMNYNNNMGFMLTFILGSMGLVGILHTYMNIAGLRIEAGKVEPTFAGVPLKFRLWLDNSGHAARYALMFIRENDEEGTPIVIADALENERAAVDIAVPTYRRGRIKLGKLLLQSHFPLGVFRTWAYIELDMEGMIYPSPGGQHLLPPGTPESGGNNARTGLSGEDFVGHRDYSAGDSPHHIDWKIAARERGWKIKQFGGGTGDTTLWLSWEDVLHLGNNTEAALSQLCRWVLNADSQSLDYGLRLPELTILPSHGKAHRKKCLDALALF
ncbi:MAG: DUF58 domain-containing protein, partial [Pseudomonadota bacterium]